MLFFSLHPLPLRLSLSLSSFHSSGDDDSVESQSEQGHSQDAPGSDADVQVSLSPEDPDQGIMYINYSSLCVTCLCNMCVSIPDKAVDASGKETDPSVPSKEDIPTFDEWKKQVMEVEKEKTLSLHTSSSGIPPVKKVQKNFKNNYASVECGAKMLSANTEAKSTSAILMENMDLYMLNPCSNKIWFVIELCEPIQVKQLDIANFELFSSTPKDFLVSISDRYPTNKWVKLGTFHARDERTVQSFPLDEQLYAKYVKMFIKYIKVELISHFGSEHFCPLSLIRVFGTSMVEEYEEIADSQYPSERLEYLDEDYDYPPGYLHSEDKGSKNLLGSATSILLCVWVSLPANASSEAQNQTEGNKEVLLTPTPTITTPPPAVEPDHHAPQEDPDVDGQIVTLVVEEEEPPQSTVTLMEEEGDDDEEREEQYRKQMEEMQRAFNKTIIKLQNTSRIAGEQDQRQTESIQMLQGQLENVTKLMINLTMTVSQLQKEVSDRQSYLVVSLVLCLCLGLVFCLHCCRSTNTQTTTHTAVNHYPSPKRCFSSYEDMSLKRRISCPLVRSKSFTFPTSEVGPDDLYIVEPLRFSPEKKVQCPLLSSPSATAVVWWPPRPSCFSSTHSEESYISRGPPLSSTPCMFNGHAAIPVPLCLPSLPPSKKRSAKRQRSRQVELQLSSRQTGGAMNSLPSLQQLIKGNKKISVGTIGPTAVTGHV
uniref:SUN domain-containing ossification factor n=1 Tax=Oncorhynchus tshawytscha TaxID=74940 RepID=A0A8C8HCX8_ONCTS